MEMNMEIRLQLESESVRNISIISFPNQCADSESKGLHLKSGDIYICTKNWNVTALTFHMSHLHAYIWVPSVFIWHSQYSCLPSLSWMCSSTIWESVLQLFPPRQDLTDSGCHKSTCIIALPFSEKKQTLLRETSNVENYRKELYPRWQKR